MRILQIAMPRVESGIIHRVIDAWIALYRLGGQIVDKIKVRVVSKQRSMNVATQISSYFSSIFDGVSIKLAQQNSLQNHSFERIYLGLSNPSPDLTGFSCIRGPLVRQKLETGN
jgi:hypothetical protein